jgi:signal transduction histidine kinase
MSRVLIVEDEPALLECYCELVAGLGHEYVTARDGDTALAVARESVPDLVITDFMMPGKTGSELIAELRARSELAGVPMILISAGRPSDAVRRAAWRFLPKPVNPEVFERAIEEGLRRARTSRPPSPASHATASDQASPVSFVREQMLSWVAHEIKSPLAAAMTASHLAQRSLANRADPSEVERRLAVITRQLTRMDELVNSILDAAQLEEGRLSLALAPVEVSAFLANIVSFWKDIHPELDITVNDGKNIIVDADEERLRQIIDNLISNAIKYGQPSKSIRIDASHDDTHVRIAVTDQGRGIPEAELAHIFDRFHRVAGQGGRGHGLGLYIASALTRLHGGSLAVQSELGKGSTFTIVLPRRGAAH